MSIQVDESYEILKCDICNKPLSVPPIIHSALLGYICGRCENKSKSDEKYGDSIAERQIIYENLAKYITFPCAYNVLGCSSMLKWESVLSHEDICEFKNIVCPLSHQNFQEQCPWIGDHNQLITHIKKDHKKFFSNPLQIKLTKEFESKILFWEITGHIVVIILDRKDTNKYFCCISADFNNKDCLKYQYQLEISNKQWGNPVIFQRDHLEPLYGNTFTRPDNSIEIDIESLKYLFKKSNEIIIKFTINQKVVSATSTISNAADKYFSKVENELNENLLHDLECPICVQYMTSPIFICEMGHNVCHDCHWKISRCPICRGNMQGGRNFTLEKLTEKINYPCVNREIGCSFVGLLANLKKHENNCLLAQRECFIGNCSWKGAHLDLKAHFEEIHNLIEPDTIHVHQLQKKVDQYFISFDNKLFLLNIRFDINKPFEYIVQCIGDDKIEYKHELQIIGSSLIDIKIKLCHLCQPLDYKVDRKTIRDFTGIAIPFTFLSQFLTHFNQIEFKIKIMKIDV
ncbi:hypothetical protein HHI36_019068 [Cryptolaemus montrouzieri]|uniref:RING-type E3 ubiquitin transferase n=1 Tax=Cryptolaemus montrouzieri TaxID=559131 RepID=A0ABD2P2N3_9CUCU